MDFAKVDELQARLKALRPLSAGELKRIRDEFVIVNTYDSNAIEGNTLTLRETALILEHGITIAEKPVKEHLEAIGYRDAFNFVTELADKNAELTESAIKLIHSLVLMNDRANAGVYRKVPVSIVGAVHTPPQPYLIAPQMEQLIADFDQNMHCDERSLVKRHVMEMIAEFHLRFERIHPFIDGNGRTGRLLLNLELIKAGYLPINIKFADRRKYYDCFDDFYKSGNITTLTSLITAYEVEELEKYIALCKG